MARKNNKDRGVVEKPAGSGKWWVRLFVEGKERRWRCDTRSQAKALYGKLKGQAREEKLFPKEKKRDPLLFKTVTTDYEEGVDTDRRRPGDDKARVQYWIDRFGKQDVESIETNQIEQAMTALRAPLGERSGRLTKGQRRSLETVRRYYGVVHAILEKARKRLKSQKIHWMNPASDIELKKADNSLVRYLTPDQEQALLDALPERYHPLIVTALHTGMRRGELLRLTWADIDWFSGTLKIQETKIDEPRHAPMNSAVQKTLLALKESVKPAPCDRVFPFNPRYLGRAFQRAVIRAKVAPFRFHDLRHCFASRLARLGVNDRTLMEAGGWKSPAMLRRYVHLGPSSVWQAVEQLAETNTRDKTGTKTGTGPKRRREEVASNEATS